MACAVTCGGGVTVTIFDSFASDRKQSPGISFLVSPLYLAALSGLLLNDFVLKSAAPGFVTGKLSDFCGLFAFAVFWSVLLPGSRLQSAGVSP